MKSKPSRSGTNWYPEGPEMEDILVPTGAQPFSRLILTRAEENVNFCLWREAGPAYRQPMIAMTANTSTRV